MAEKKPIPVRLPDELIVRLDSVAAAIGTTRANVIRFCTDTFTSHFLDKGQAILPPDWQGIMASYDGRRPQSGGLQHLADVDLSKLDPKVAEVIGAIVDGIESGAKRGGRKQFAETPGRAAAAAKRSSRPRRRK